MSQVEEQCIDHLEEFGAEDGSDSVDLNEKERRRWTKPSLQKNSRRSNTATLV